MNMEISQEVSQEFGGEGGRDYRQARLVLGLRSAGVSDTRVMSAMEAIPREMFVPKAFHHHAYENVTLPIGHQQTLSQPGIVGVMTQALNVTDRSKVLEVGTGSGYQTSVLAKLCRRVYTVERYRPLLAVAEQRFKELKLHNITTKLGDGTLGWVEQTPFERIIVTAAALDVPPVLADQLTLGGIMVVPIGSDPSLQTILKVVRHEDGFEAEELRDVKFVPLIPAEVQEAV
jgi:protein-L-isoaspartate(D-aspartate) O-methyltransferase